MTSSIIQELPISVVVFTNFPFYKWGTNDDDCPGIFATKAAGIEGAIQSESVSPVRDDKGATSCLHAREMG